MESGRIPILRPESDSPGALYPPQLPSPLSSCVRDRATENRPVLGHLSTKRPGNACNSDAGVSDKQEARMERIEGVDRWVWGRLEPSRRGQEGAGADTATVARGESGGQEHKNVASGDASLSVLCCLMAGRGGGTCEARDVEGEAAAVLSNRLPGITDVCAKQRRLSTPFKRKQL